MELIDYIHIARRRWALILVVLIACVAGSWIATKLTTPTYSTSAELIVNGSSQVSATDEISTRELAVERATSFAQVAGTAPAVQAALKEAEATTGPFNPKGYPSVSASASGTTPFIYIRVSDTDPHRAQAVANAYITVLPGVIKKLEQSTSATPEEISVLQPAGYPSAASSPKPKRNLIIGFALGIVLGAGAALVRESLDRRLKDSQDVEDATGLTVLGVVPYEMPGELTPAETHPMSVRAEAYRKIRTNLTFVTESGAPKSIVITSATSNEGKTTLATNLAIACAKGGQKVAIVDADLRRPMVHKFFDLPDEKGLVDVLGGTATLPEVMQYTHDGRLAVLVAGPVPANPSELMGSAAMLEVIRRLERRFDIVILDSPPVLPVADALAVGVNVDGVVVVTRLGETTRDKLRRTKEALAKVHVTVVGVVPNGAIQREDSAYAYAYRYRSKRKAPVLPYAPRDPQVEPNPDDLRPAGRDIPDSWGDVPIVGAGSDPPIPSEKHFSAWSDMAPATDDEPTNGHQPSADVRSAANGAASGHSDAGATTPGGSEHGPGWSSPPEAT